MHRRFTMGEVARRTGVPVKTLRFYSDEGLLPPADRTASGYRLYGEEDVGRLERIRTLRDAGPSREQLDAWIELCELFADQGFVASLRSHGAEVWTADFDLAASLRASEEATAAARAAIDRGLDPACAEGAAIVERFVQGYAAAMGRAPDRAFRDWLVAHYRDRDPRMVRYGELLAVLRGEPALARPSEEWSWLIEASRAHLSR